MLYIAESLKKLRKEKDWTQETLAEMIGVSPQSVSKWERGDTYPDITLLPTLANLYKVSVDTIIGMDKINQDHARQTLFATVHEHLHQQQNDQAEELLRHALKTFPSDGGILLELAMVLALKDEPEILTQAIALCERVLANQPTEKVRHTTQAVLALMHYKLGEKEKAVAVVQQLPHLRESREYILRELWHEPDTQTLNEHLKLMILGGDEHDTISIRFGTGLMSLFDEPHNLLTAIKTLREQGLKLPVIRIRDHTGLDPHELNFFYYGSRLLCKTYTDPALAIHDIVVLLRSLAG